jgi:serine/threonine protein kinase
MLEVCIDISQAPDQYFVYHILETLEKDLDQEIQQRITGQSPYSEQEIWNFLKQTSSALSFAHEKVLNTQKIAHRDIKPGNIFINSEDQYKVGDFGCYFEKKYTSQAKTFIGSLVYMSPEQRQVYLDQIIEYNPFKTDVFELGMTALAMASLDPPTEMWPLARIDQTAIENVQPLPYSSTLKSLLLEMLSAREEDRPAMQTVQSAAETQLILFTPTLAAELQGSISPERLEELGLLLLAASKNSAQSYILQKLQACEGQLGEKLIALLTEPGKLTIAVLERLYLQLSQVIRNIPTDEPAYRSISPGLSFKSKCIHRGCAAYNDTIYITKGLGDFDIAVESANLICPKCGNAAEISTNCGFYLAQWRFQGITQEGEVIDSPPGRTDTQEYYTLEEGNNTNWRSLKVEVSPYTP